MAGSDLLYRYLKVKFGHSDNAELDTILTSDYKEHQPSVIRGTKEVKEFAVKLKKAFPKQRFEVLDKIYDNDKVAFRYEWHGVHTGQFFDWKPTNKEISTHGIILAKITDNRIAETWEEWDFAGFAKQLDNYAQESP